MRQFMRIAWLETIELGILFVLACSSLVLWDYSGFKAFNSLPKQASFILLSAIIATLGPWWTALRLGKHRGAHWSTLNFSLPFLLVVVPPVFFSVITNDTMENGVCLEENFIKVFYPMLGSALVVMVMVHVLVIVEMWNLHRKNPEQQQILPWMAICFGIVGLGMLVYGMSYYADAHGDLGKEIKRHLFYGGYIISTLFSLFGLGLLIWLEQ